MPLHLSVLASGSRSNALLLTYNGQRILIDAGLGIRSLTQTLNLARTRVDEISAVLLTHEHIDHVRGLSKLLERSRAVLYASDGTLRAVDPLLPARCRAHALTHETVEIGPFAVRGIPVPHDAAEPLAYHICAGRHRLTVATDLGEVPLALAKALARSTCAVLESNHDEAMLRAGPYPEVLKTRIASPQGHLSNRQAAGALKTCVGNGLRTVVLAHLSDENNTPALARAAALLALRGSGAALHLTARTAAGPFLTLENCDP